MTHKRILLLTTVMEAGGAQKAMMQLAKGLLARGHRVTVVAMYHKHGHPHEFEKRFGVPVNDLSMNPAGSRVRKGFALVRGAVRLWRLLREHRVQVIQSFTHYSNLLGPVVGWLAAVPVRVTSQRNTLENRSSLLPWSDRWVSRLRLAHCMVAVSSGVRRYCIEQEGLAAHRVVTIVNGLELPNRASEDEERRLRGRIRRSLDLADEDQAILTVARLVPQKGYRILLNAVDQLTRSWPRARFLWVGDGVLKEELATGIRQRGLEGRVRLLGTRFDIDRLLRGGDLFVLPSTSEGMPNAVLEAMGAGLPVVATDVNGISEMVQEGRTGWLVAPGDPEALAGAIDEALRGPELRMQAGHAGRRRVADYFSVERFVDRFDVLYAELA